MTFPDLVLLFYFNGFRNDKNLNKQNTSSQKAEDFTKPKNLVTNDISVQICFVHKPAVIDFPF